MKAAELKLNRPGFGETLNPYVKITAANDKVWKSAVDEKGGLTPTWHLQTVEFDVTDLSDTLSIEVADRDTPLQSSDNLIGHCKQECKLFCEPKGASVWLNLWFDAKPAGRILFESEFRPNALSTNEFVT